MRVRHPSFDLEHAVPHWGDNIEACTVINGGAIIPPPIERYLIKVVRRAKQLLDPVADAELLEADLDEFLATQDLAWNLGYGEEFESSGAAEGWLDGAIAQLCGDRGSEPMRLWVWHLAEEFDDPATVPVPRRYQEILAAHS